MTGDETPTGCAGTLHESLLETIDDVVFVVNESGDLEYINDAGRSFLSDQAAVSAGDSVRSVARDLAVSEDVVERVERELAALFEPEGPASNRLTFRLDDAEADAGRVAEFRLSRMDLSESKKVAVVARDVTEQTARERALARYERLVENLPVGVYRSTAGESGEFKLVNEAMVEMFDAESEADLLSHPVSALYADPSDRAEFSSLLKSQGIVEGRTLQLQTLSGEQLWGEVTAVASETDGDTVFDGAVQDITQRIEYERRLQESEAEYRSLTAAFDTTGVGTFLLDEEETVVWVNAAVEEYLALSREEVSGTEMATLVESQLKHVFDRPDRFAETVLESYETDAYLDSFECHVQAGPDREERWLLHWSEPIESGHYAGGRVEYYTDISERVAYEQRLEEQRDNLELLNQMVRHDIRNDLQLVMAHADHLTNEVADANRESVETILESTDHAVDLTTSARDMAEVMLKPESELQAVPLRSTLEAQIDNLESRAEDATVTLEDEIPPVEVRANELLESVFRNLLQNAVQHNDAEHPQVTVSVEEQEDHVVVAVADNGPGVPEAKKDVIFGRGEKGLESSGTGIGLYLVDTLVGRYDGDVWVDDNDPEGAVFKVKLLKAA